MQSLKFCVLIILNLFIENFTFNNENVTRKAFIDLVIKNFTLCGNYTLPTNNEKLVYVSSTQTKINDFGSFDFIIVGAGSAGTLLANRLSEIKDWNILLLEAGSPQNDFSSIPGMNINHYLTDMNWGYLTTPQLKACKAMEQNQCVSPRGKGVGGTSIINGKIYARGNRADYNSWEEMGNTGWSYDKILPYFKKTENCAIYDVDPEYHSKEGMLNVSYPESTIFGSIFLKGNGELGYNVTDYNGRDQIGVSKIQFNIAGNKNVDGGKAFIDPFLYRTNLNVTTNAFVTKLLLDKISKKVFGVEFIKEGKKYTVEASKEVILSAGSINTPQILMISGIGPREELNRIGVDVIVNIPVGKVLEDHLLFVGLNIRTNITLFNQSMEILLEKYVNGHRPFTAPFSLEAHAFLNTVDKYSSIPNIQQILVVPIGVGPYARRILNLKETYNDQLNKLCQPYNDIQIWVVLLHPKSKGSVTLKSKDPLDFPNIQSNIFDEEEDIKTMLKGIKETLKLLETDAFKSINATFAPIIEICTNFKIYSDDYWYCLMEYFTMSAFHPVGSTRMGTSSKDSVVNSNLTVHGIKKLRIVDAGIMPKIISAPINAPIYMIAEKAADIIKEHYGQPVGNNKII